MNDREQQQIEAAMRYIGAGSTRDVVITTENDTYSGIRRVSARLSEWQRLNAGRDDAAATIENVYSLLAMIAADIPPGKRFAELYAALELIDAWRERARETERE